MKNMSRFAGHFTCMDKNGEENTDEGIVLEVTEVKKDGSVEIAFDDRNERCYLTVKLGDLFQAVCLFSGGE